MNNPQVLKKRLKTVRNIAKITKSMQLVAVSKMQRFQNLTQHINQYTEQLLNILNELNIAEVPSQFASYFSTNKSNLHSELFVILAPTRGFTGTLLNNYVNTIKKYIRDHPSRRFVTVGLHSKAQDIAKYSNLTLNLQYEGEITNITPEIVEHFFNFIMKVRARYNTNRVMICYPKFENIFTYQVKIEQYLPVPTMLTKQLLPPQPTQYNPEYLLEPTKTAVIQKILELYLEGYLVYTLANLNASEFSARMVAMKNAYENALELQESLMQEFNKVRQSSITNMISDIIRANI